MAAAAGLAIGRLWLLRSLDTGSPETGPAEECSVCGNVKAPGEPNGCNCGSAYVEAEVPKLLAGKFRLTRRLGSGGMGAAYLARDIRLERNVALKTPTGRSVSGWMGTEAGSLGHGGRDPSGGRTDLRTRVVAGAVRSFVVEYLAGGTLQTGFGVNPSGQRMQSP